MRVSERLFVYGGVVLAIGLAAAWAGAPGARGVTPKIATVDVFVIAEKLMARPELVTPRDELFKTWNDRATAAQAELNKLQTELQVLPQSDPVARVKGQDFQLKRAQFDQLMQQGNTEVEKYRAQQLLDCYTQARAAIDEAADRGEYTHVFVARSRDALIEPQSIALAIQEFLARPAIKYPAEDDLTKQVMADLKLE